MGNACCKAPDPDLNPDGSPKEPQTLEQEENNVIELFQAALEGDHEHMEDLLRRIPSVKINSQIAPDAHACAKTCILWGGTCASVLPPYCGTLLCDQVYQNIRDNGCCQPQTRPNDKPYINQHLFTASPPFREDGTQNCFNQCSTTSCILKTAYALSTVDAGQGALHICAANGDAVGVRKLLKYGCRPNTHSNTTGKTPFMLAGEAGFRSVMQILMEAGANPNLRDKKADSPLLCAMRDGRREQTNWLLGLPNIACADLSRSNSAGDRPLIIALRNGWFDVAKKLLGLGVTNVNATGKNKETALGWVLKWGCHSPIDADLLQQLQSFGANQQQAAFSIKAPPGCLAAAAGVLLELSPEQENRKPTNWNTICDALRRNALHYAAATGKADICQKLLELGVSPVSVDRHGDTPLHLAAGRGHGEVVELLLGVVDNPTAMILQPNKERLSPWHLTLMRSELMDGDNGQQAALHMLKIAGEASAAEAAGEGMPGTTGTEQDAGATRTEGQEEEEEEEEASAPLLPADAHSVDRAGGTAPAEVSVMQLLLQPIQNDIGDTPLLLAVGSHQNQVVRELLKLEPELAWAANVAGEMPIWRCMTSTSSQTKAADADILDQLLQHTQASDMEKMDSLSAMGYHPVLALCMTSECSFSATALDLLTVKFGSLPWQSVHDGEGNTSLGLAALHDNPFMVKHLLDIEKCNIDEKMTGSGATPVMMAAMGAAQRSLKVLLNRGPVLNERDASGRSALSYCLHTDCLASVVAGAMLVQEGERPEDCVAGNGEGLLHRAIRYGLDSFISIWAVHSGNLAIKCTTTPEAEAAWVKPKKADAFLDVVTLHQIEEAKGDADEAETGMPTGMSLAPDPSSLNLAAGPVAEAAGADDADWLEEYEGMVAGGLDWWDAWYEDVMYGAAAGELDEEVHDLEVDEMVDLGEVMDAMALEAANAPEHGSATADAELPRTPGPLAEAKESKSYLSEFSQGAPHSSASAPFDAFFESYHGTPLYMQDIDVSPIPEEAIREMVATVKPAGDDNVADEEPMLEGEELRVRNMAWYHRALPPSEFPLKMGQWKKVNKAEAAKKRAIASGKRHRTSKFNLPVAPALSNATALVAAVRFGRLACLRRLLAYSSALATINIRDGHGVGPLGYAMRSLYFARHDTTAIKMVEELLLARPVARLQGSGVMNPLVIATIMGHRPYMAFLAHECAASMDTASVFLPDIPAYFKDKWRKQVAKCPSTCTALHLAVLHRTKFDLVKLALDLGADPNLFGLPKNHEKELIKFQRHQARKAKSGLYAFVTSFKLPGLGKPEAWCTPLHLAAHLGLPSIIKLLLSRGAFTRAYPAIAKKTPLEEALAFAKSNNTMKNVNAEKAVWAMYRDNVKLRAADLPLPKAALVLSAAKMMAGAGGGEALQKWTIGLAIKAVIKSITASIMESRRAPMAHRDPAMAGAHILMWHRAELALKNVLCASVVRDMIDNNTHAWINLSAPNPAWTIAASSDFSVEREAMTKSMELALSFKKYEKIKKMLRKSAEKRYAKSGQEKFLEKYQQGAEQAQKDQSAKWRALLEANQERLCKAKERMQAALSKRLQKNANEMKAELSEWAAKVGPGETWYAEEEAIDGVHSALEAVDSGVEVEDLEAAHGVAAAPATDVLDDSGDDGAAEAEESEGEGGVDEEGAGASMLRAALKHAAPAAKAAARRRATRRSQKDVMKQARKEPARGSQPSPYQVAAKAAIKQQMQAMLQAQEERTTPSDAAQRVAGAMDSWGAQIMADPDEYYQKAQQAVSVVLSAMRFGVKIQDLIEEAETYAEDIAKVFEAGGIDLFEVLDLFG